MDAAHWNMAFWYGIRQMAHTIHENPMTAKLTLDKAGRLVLPKPVRDQIQVGPGDTLTLEIEEGRITLRPLRSSSALQKERGVWVYRTGQPLPSSVVSETLRQVRGERDRAALSKTR